MSTVNLRKLLSRSDVFPVLSQILSLAGTPVRISDAGDAFITGTDISLPHKVPVTLHDEVVGWVTGEGETEPVAALLCLLASREFERRALARETLEKYKEIALLYDFSEKVSARHELAEIAQLAIAELTRMIEADVISIVPFPGGSGDGELLGTTDPEGDRILTGELHRKIHAIIAAGGSGEIINDSSSDPRFAALMKGISSFMYTPMKVGDRITGAISVRSSKPLTYSARELRLLAALASVVALSMENVRYFKELLRATAEKEIMESKKALFSDISHELGGPLARMQVALEMIQDRVREGKAPSLKSIESLTDDVSEMSALVEEVRELARFDVRGYVVKKEPACMEKLVSSVVESLKLLAGKKNITLWLTRDSDGIETMMDPDKIKRVIHNLVMNAIKYSPPESTIEIIVTCRDGRCTVSVKDQGLGILKENASRIFEPFFREDKSRTRETGGMGLGLSIARKIIAIHEGRIWVENPGEQGACITFSL